jgi:hypothetical protein
MKKNFIAQADYVQHNKLHGNVVNNHIQLGI